MQKYVFVMHCRAVPNQSIRGVKGDGNCPGVPCLRGWHPLPHLLNLFLTFLVLIFLNPHMKAFRWKPKWCFRPLVRLLRRLSWPSKSLQCDFRFLYENQNWGLTWHLSNVHMSPNGWTDLYVNTGSLRPQTKWRESTMCNPFSYHVFCWTHRVKECVKKMSAIHSFHGFNPISLCIFSKNASTPVKWSRLALSNKTKLSRIFLDKLKKSDQHQRDQAEWRNQYSQASS